MLENIIIAMQILQSIGGSNNIDSISCCSTKLKIKVKKEELIDKMALINIPAVKGTFRSRGFFYLLLGIGEVRGVYDALYQLMSNEPHPKYITSFIELDDNTNVLEKNNCFVCPKCGYKMTTGHFCPFCGSTVVRTREKPTEPVIINNNYYNPTIQIYIENLSINGLTFNQITKKFVKENLNANITDEQIADVLLND